MGKTKVPHRSKGRRRTIEQQQERKSRHQLAEAWEDWPLQSSAEDLGEDLLFQIYDKGNFTGLSFYVQLKSTSDIQKFVSKHDSNKLKYSVATKDLIHWENSATPVVLVIWDVAQRTGYWAETGKILKALDAHGPSWRSKVTATVDIPLTNKSDSAGRRTLRAEIASIVLPVLSHGKEVAINPTFVFPNTPDGKAAVKALRETLDEGGSTTITKEHIKQFKMSDWWERAHGEVIPDSVTITSSPRTERLNFRLHAIGAKRSESLSVDVVQTKGGLRTLTLETPKDGGSVHVRLVLHHNQERLDIQLRFDHPCRTVHESLALTKFLIAAQGDSIVQVALATGDILGEVSGPLINGGRRLDELLRWEKLLEKLSYIQGRVARFGTFDLRALHDGLLPKIERLHTILSTGEYRSKIDFSFTLDDRHDPSVTTGEGALTIDVNPFGEETLLGVKIPLGHVRMELLEPSVILTRIRAWNAGKRKSPHVSSKATPVLHSFWDWTPPKTGPELLSATEVQRKTRSRKGTERTLNRTQRPKAKKKNQRHA